MKAYYRLAWKSKLYKHEHCGAWHSGKYLDELKAEAEEKNNKSKSNYEYSIERKFFDFDPNERE